MVGEEEASKWLWIGEILDVCIYTDIWDQLIFMCI